jgi:hypothetical protein
VSFLSVPIAVKSLARGTSRGGVGSGRSAEATIDRFESCRARSALECGRSARVAPGGRPGNGSSARIRAMVARWCTHARGPIRPRIRLIKGGDRYGRRGRREGGEGSFRPPFHVALGAPVSRHRAVCFESGRNIRQVQRWLGHHSPSFTLDTYVHLLDEGIGEGLDIETALPAISADARPVFLRNGAADNERNERAHRYTRSGPDSRWSTPASTPDDKPDEP